MRDSAGISPDFAGATATPDHDDRRRRRTYEPRRDRVKTEEKTVSSDLDAEPIVLTGALVGYSRVSTRDQNLDRQTDALTAAGCLRIFADKASGKTSARPALARALDFMRPGDTLVVASLDRLSRSLADLIAMVTELRRRGVGFRSDRADSAVAAQPPSEHLFDLDHRYLPERHGTRLSSWMDVPSRVDLRPEVVDAEVVP